MLTADVHDDDDKNDGDTNRDRDHHGHCTFMFLGKVVMITLIVQMVNDNVETMMIMMIMM